MRTGELRSGNKTTDPNDIDNQSPDNFPITYHLNLDDASSKLRWYVIGKLSGLWLSMSLGSVVLLPDLSSPVLNSKSNPSTIPS